MVRKLSAVFILSATTCIAQAVTGNPVLTPITTTANVFFKAAGCQNATPATGFDLPAANAPVATCQTFDTDNKYGTLSFDPTTQETVFFSFQLAVGYVAGSLDADLVWFTAATSGDVRWAVRIQCIAASEQPGVTWEDETAVNDTADATGNDWNLAQIVAIDDTACAAGETVVGELYRDSADAADTVNANDAELVSARFFYNVQQ